MAKRNTPKQFDFHFYCYTDDAEGLDHDVNVIPFPDINSIHPKYWFGKEDFKYGMARCWDRAKTFVFNTHNFASDKPSGRFVFFDLDVIIQNDLTPIIMYNTERPTKMCSWWQDPAPMKTRRFKLSHGAHTNGSCKVWSDDQCEVIWNDVLENQEKIWFTYTDGTDNYHSWRWKELWDHFPSHMAYSYNRGRSWDEDDLLVGKYRSSCIVCVFNVDLLPFEDASRGSTKQDDLVDPKLLEHWLSEC
jgi:hypothetical protein|tara:strand:+ start:3153 stop:3890 length:738 start_codon:yes stop_codon:yes gene_type:complete